jgi:hypothetical protein
MIKTFFSWLILQCVFARVLFGLSIELWKSIHFQGSDGITTFVGSAVVICLAETIASAIILSDMLIREQNHTNDMRKLEFQAAHPEQRYSR